MRRVVSTGPLITGSFMLVVLLAAGFADEAAAQQVFTNDEPGFQAALTGGVTLANLDEPPLDADDDVPAGDAQFLSLGIEVRSPTSIASGQQFQIAKVPRDRLLLNGSGSGVPSFCFDFVTPQHGVGALANFDDGGVLRAYSGPGPTGTLLAEVPFGVPSGAFGGVVTTQLIRSVEITCDFDFDLRCGIYDIQFGRVAPGRARIAPSGLGCQNPRERQ